MLEICQRRWQSDTSWSSTLIKKQILVNQLSPRNGQAWPKRTLKPNKWNEMYQLPGEVYFRVWLWRVEISTCPCTWYFKSVFVRYMKCIPGSHACGYLFSSTNAKSHKPRSKCANVPWPVCAWRSIDGHIVTVPVFRCLINRVTDNCVTQCVLNR